MKATTREQTTIRVSFVSIGGNLFLCLLKLIGGILGRSGALVSDAAHSAADAIDTIIIIIGIKIAAKGPDAGHPYGHERMECVAAILLSVILGAVGLGIGFSGLEKLFSSQEGSALPLPGRLALFVSLISIVIKESLYWYMRFRAKRINSDSLMAIAWHNRTDALSSIGSFIGILGARAGFLFLDPLVSVLISLFVIKAVYVIFKGAVDKMVDRACDPQAAKAIRQEAESYAPDLIIKAFRTRLFGDKIYIDMEVFMPPDCTLEVCYNTCLQLQTHIESAFEQVKECRVIPVPQNTK